MVKERDTILIGPGIYKEHLSFSGTAMNDGILLKPTTAGAPVIVDGSGIVDVAAGLEFVNHINGIVLERLEIRNWIGKGIEVSGAQNLTLRSLNVHDNGTGILLNSARALLSKNVRILECEVHNNGGEDNQGHGIYLAGEGHEVARSRVHHNGVPGLGYGIHLYIGHMDVPRVARKIEVHDNYIYANGHGVIIGGDPAVKDNKLIRNIVCGNENNGVVIEEQSQGNVVKGNTMMGNVGAGIRWNRTRTAMAGAKPNVIKENSVLARPADAEHPHIVPLTVISYPGRDIFDPPQTHQFDHNIYGPEDSEVQWQMDTDGSVTFLSFEEWQSRGPDQHSAWGEKEMEVPSCP
jgi:hypothetical protein